jgi:NitT/TauT family transport system permease protein
MAVLAVLAWEVACRVLKIPTIVLAPPSAILDKIVRFYPLLLQNSVSTTMESLLAFFVTVFLGIVLAAAITYSRLLYEMLYPNLVFFQLIPKIALAPLFILWFGIHYESRVAFSVFISFFPMLIATAAGLGNVDANMIRLCRSLGATKWQILVSVRFPASIPYIFSGMKISVTLAIIGIIVGEFITSQSGLGYLILFASGNQDTPLIFASIAVLCVVGLLMYSAIVVVERVTNHWLVSTVTRT